MGSFLFVAYISLILVRPMDWWEPVKGMELVNFTAIALFFVSLPVILARFPRVWADIPQLKAALAFLIGAMLSWATKFWLGGAQIVFETLGKIMFFFALLLTLVDNRQHYRMLLWTFLGCTLWLALHAILQHYQGYGFGGKRPLWRIRDRVTGEGVFQSLAFGTLSDPNDLCLVLVAAIPLFYAQFKILPNPIWKAFSLAGLATVAYGAYCTNSRGGIIGVFGMIMAYTLARTRGIRRYVIAAVAISMVTVLAPSRFGRGMTDKSRAVLWGDGLAMFKSSPIFGIGFNDFTTYSNEHQVAHNTFIHTLAELGLVGYLPLFVLIYLTLIHLRRLINQKDYLLPDDRLLLAGVFASVSGYLTGAYFISRQYQHILYLLFALAITAVYVICTERNLYAPVYGPVKRDVRNGLLLGLASVFVMWITVRAAHALS